MIPFLKELNLTITFHNHLIKIISDAKGPTEIGEQEIMCEERHYDTQPTPSRDSIQVLDVDTYVSAHDADTQIHDQFDWERQEIKK